MPASFTNKNYIRWIKFRNKCTDLGDVCNIEKSQNMKLDTVWNFSLREEKPYQSAKLWALKQQFMHCQVTLSSHKMKIRKVFVLSTTYFHEKIITKILSIEKTKAKNSAIKMVKSSSISLAKSKQNNQLPVRD